LSQRLLEAALALAMFGMMTVTFVDVAGRFLFASPIAGASELIQVLMAAVVATALPLVTRSRQHITMALFTGAIEGPAKRLLDAAIMAMSAVVLGALAALLAQQAVSLQQARASTIFLDLPVAPVAWVLTVSTGAACLLELAALAGSLRGARSEPAA
jgi:TRAP-type C4-dicarboxylate transport system permease small subunit